MELVKQKVNLIEMIGDLIEVENAEVEENIKNEIIEAIKEEINTKADNIIRVVKDFENRIEGIKSEEKRLAEYRKSQEKQLDNLKKYTVYCMEMLDKKKMDTTMGKISLRKKPDTLEIVEAEKVPSEFKEEVITTTVKIDKNEIKRAIKEGQNIEGVKMVKGENSLAIK